jgi:hypothetical protein
MRLRIAFNAVATRKRTGLSLIQEWECNLC